MKLNEVDVDIVEQREVGVDRNIVLESVAPVFYEVRLEELVFLRVDRVAELSGIAHRDLFIPALFAGHVLALERIKSAHRNVEVRQREAHGRVLSCSG